MKNQKESPIKEKHLRLPGQSLDEQIAKLREGKVLPYIIAGVLFIYLAVMEWYRWYVELPYTLIFPMIITTFAIPIAAFSFYKCRKLHREIQNLKLGRDGERFVGQYLEQLREKGYHVFHDVINERGNIDHVIICERGIFTIETKTYSKERGNEKVVVNDECITINGFDNYKIAMQAIAQAKWLRDLFSKPPEKQIFVQPVVIFPNRYVDSSNGSKKLWVLSHNGLPTYIENNFGAISKEDVKIFSTCLDIYIRTK